MRGACGHTVRTDKASKFSAAHWALRGDSTQLLVPKGPATTPTQDGVNLIGTGAKRQLSEFVGIDVADQRAYGENARSEGID